MDSEKCVSVCACLPAQKQTRCYTVCLKGAKKKNQKTGRLWTQTMITSPVVYVSQLMPLPSLAHGHNMIL